MHTPTIFKPGKSNYVVITREIILPGIICLGVILLCYICLYSPVFRIKTITCRLDFEDCQNPNLISELDSLMGKNIFSLKIAPLKQKLTSGDFTIRSVEIHRSLPGSVSFDLQSVYPVVAIQVKDNPTWIVFDAQYRFIASRDVDPNVPTLILLSPITLSLGKPINNPTLHDALALALRLSDELLNFKSLTLVDDDTLLVNLQTGVVAIFTPKGDLDPQIRSLQAVLSDATISKGVRQIDVRFSQPVLR